MREENSADCRWKNKNAYFPVRISGLYPRLLKHSTGGHELPGASMKKNIQFTFKLIEQGYGQPALQLDIGGLQGSEQVGKIDALFNKIKTDNARVFPPGMAAVFDKMHPAFAKNGYTGQITKDRQAALDKEYNAYACQTLGCGDETYSALFFEGDVMDKFLRGMKKIDGITVTNLDWEHALEATRQLTELKAGVQR
jgi:hypothetical protein